MLKNWSPLWKALAITASTGVSFTQGFGPLALAPMFPYLIEEYESDLAGVVRFVSQKKDCRLTHHAVA